MKRKKNICGFSLKALEKCLFMKKQALPWNQKKALSRVIYENSKLFNNKTILLIVIWFKLLPFNRIELD